MMKKFFTRFLAALALLVCMTPSMVAWGQTRDAANYQIVFKTGSNDGTTITTGMACSTIVSSGENYLSGNVAAASNAYHSGSSGLKLGKSGGSGSLTMNLSQSGQVTPTSIVVSAKRYNTSKSATLSVNGATAQTVSTSSDFNNYTFAITSSITTLQLNSSQYIWVASVTVNYTTGGGDTPTTTYTVTYDANGADSGDVPVDDDEYESGDDVTVLGNTGNLAKEHYTFGGWNTLANGSGTTYQAGNTFEITSNTTLYAKWNPNTNTVTLPANDQYGTYTMDATNPVAYGTTVNLTYTPVSGYESYAATWSVNGSAIEGNSFTMPDEAVTVTVSLMALVVDNIDADFTGNPSSYSNWSGKVGTSGAVYAGHSSGGTDYIQIRTKNSNSGIVTTTSGGKAKKVVVTWNSATSSDRKLDIYGKNTAYTQATDLYSNSTQGTKIGSIEYGTSTELTISDSYQFIGIRSNSDAAYLDLIQIAWKPNLVAIPTFSPEGGAYGGVQDVAIECETPGAIIHYTTDGSEPTSESPVYSSPIHVTETQTLKAIAIKDDDESVVATATYSIITPVTSIQAIFEAATSTSQPIAITFDNWVVSGNNGGTTPTQAYLSDGTEYGCIIYKQDGHGFVAGNILNGTVVCNVKTYTSYGYAYAQLENLTTGTSGLDVTTGGTATSTIYSISDLSAKNIGAVFTLKDITYKGSNYFQDASGNNINLSTTLYNPSSSLATGKIYDMTGVFTVTYESNSTNKRINPRSSNDVVVKANMSETDFTGLTEFTYILDNGPSEKQEIDIYGSDFGSDLTVTASEDYEISLDNTTYLASLDLEQTSGDIIETLYVRLKSGLSTDTHNGTLTFTADNLTTKVVDLVGSVTASPTYTITLNQTSGGTISANKLVAEAGETITLSAEFDDDCTEVTEWTVSGGVEVTNNQFIMPVSNVTVGATFGTKTFTINYSVNGNIEDILEDDVDCGDNAILYTASDLAGVVTLPTGFTLAGWSTSAGSTATVASFTPTEDATLYAVLIPEGAFVGYVRVTELSEITEGTYFIVNDGYVLPSATTESSPVKTNTYNIGTPLDSYNSLPVAGTEWIFTGTNTEMTIKNSAGKYLYVNGSNSTGLRVGGTPDTWAFEVHPRPGTDIFAMKDANNNRYCASYSGGSDWRSYTSANYGNYGDYGILYLYKKVEPDVYNTVTEITSTTGMTDITETDLVIVKTGGVLTLTGQNQGTAANLIIEDGGQLICTGSVAATIKRSIAAPAKESNDKWYTISSPVNNVASTLVKNLISSTDDGFTYDLYLYNEPTHYWFNQKNGSHAALFENLTNGRGYLYWNSTGSDLEFAGTLNTSDVVYPLTYTEAAGELKGFNLIGNPFSHNIYKGKGAAIDSDKLADGYYTLSNESAWHANIFSAAIAPTQGILVQATEAINLTIANSTTAATAEKKNASFIEVVASNKDYNDVAYAVFGKGIGLNKIGHLNTEIPEVYFWKNNERFAVASLNEDVEEIALNFKAATEGAYDIKVKFDGDFNYLHLIDNMTGADVDLLATPSYSFEAKTTDYASRFRLVFSANNGTNEDANETFAYFNGSEWVINGTGNATLQVIDVMGRVLRSEQINGNTAVNLNQAAGIYMLRLVNGENVMVQKVVVR